MKPEYLGTTWTHKKVLIVTTSQRRGKVGQAWQVIEAIHKEGGRKGDEGGSLSGGTKRAKEALKKSSRGGKACNVTQGP